MWVCRNLEGQSCKGLRTCLRIFVEIPSRVNAVFFLRPSGTSKDSDPANRRRLGKRSSESIELLTKPRFLEAYPSCWHLCHHHHEGLFLAARVRKGLRGFGLHHAVFDGDGW